MNFDHIHYILELTKHKSISSAAKQLHLSQPSLTMIVNKVEDELKIKLFDRTYNGIQLTPSGERALPYLQSLSHTYKMLQETLHLKEEKFIVGLNAGTIYLIQPILKKIKNLFHTFQIESIDFDQNIIESIKNRQLDLTIVTATQFEKLDKHKFTYIPFMQSKIVALSAKDYNTSVLSVADLKSKNIVLYKQQDIEHYVRQTTNVINEVDSYISTLMVN